jgi:hypothetical protein
MGTLILLIVTTAIGALIGHFGFDAALVGAVVGFVVGILLRVGAADDAIDLFD